jgi:hypothetical protein
MDDIDLTPTPDEGGLLNEAEQTVQAAANAAENLLGKITMVGVDSSDIAAWGYDPVGFKLQIQFTNNYVYLYENISPVEFEQLALSPSKGKAFWALIRRNPVGHPFTRLQ